RRSPAGGGTGTEGSRRGRPRTSRAATASRGAPRSGPCCAPSSTDGARRRTGLRTRPGRGARRPRAASTRSGSPARAPGRTSRPPRGRRRSPRRTLRRPRARRARDPRHVALLGEALTVELAGADEADQALAVAHLAPGEPEPARVVGAYDLRADRADGGIALRDLHQARDRVRRDARVVVEDEHVLGAGVERGADAGVVAAGVAEVARVRDRPEVGVRARRLLQDRSP